MKKFPITFLKKSSRKPESPNEEQGCLAATKSENSSSDNEAPPQLKVKEINGHDQGLTQSPRLTIRLIMGPNPMTCL